MANAVATTTVEKVLAAMSCHVGDDGFPTSFPYGPPDAWHTGLQTVVYFSESKFILAALYIRKHGPPYLKYLSVGDIRTLLTDFMVGNYWHLSDETFFKQFDGSYLDFVSPGMKAKMADLFEASTIMQPVSWPTLYPLVVVRVDDDFARETFFLSSPGSLLDHIGGSKVSRILRPDRFPSSKDWNGKSETPSAWLGVRSPALQSSRKMKAAILGALALTPILRERYSFSMRRMFGGHSTIDDGLTISFGRPHTPPVSSDIAIGKADHAWLAIVADKLHSSDKAASRHIKALEYFYRA